MFDDLDKGQQYLGVSEVKIHLIMTERTPDMLRTVGGFGFSQQGAGARSGHFRQIIRRVCGHEKITPGTLALNKVVEPDTA